MIGHKINAFKHHGIFTLFGLSGLLAVSILAGCNKSPGTVAPPIPEVSVQQVIQKPTALSMDIVGEIKAFREVDLRARVSGNLMKLNFRPGQKINEGDLLFVIDPGTYETALANAQASMAESAAALARVRQDVERYKPLLPDNAIPRQTYDQAVAQEQQSAAVVAGRKSAVERAKLDLGYAQVRSPVSGKIGLQKVEVGTFVSAGQTSLATVSTLDPVVVYFSVAETDYLAFVKRTETARQAGKKAVERPVELVLADGSVYDQTGQIDFSDRAVNSATGTLTLRAVFPNPKDLLRPGMTSRVRIYYDEVDDALLVHQKSVSETLGKYFVTVIGEGDKAEMRPVKLGPRVGDLWLVEGGLKNGERIVVEGVQKARPGQPVKPVPVAEPAPAVAAVK
jgi:membrane fusion protein (multidrug efflux system)